MSSTLTGLTATGSVALTDLAYTVVGGNSRKATWAVVAAAFVGGSDTQVQFNDGGAFGGDAGLTYDKTTNALTITGGTATDSAPVFNVTQTFNDAADTFVGSTIDITNTASAAASRAFRVRIGGTERFGVRVDGATMIGAGGQSWYFQAGALTSNQLDFGNTGGNPILTFLNGTNANGGIMLVSAGYGSGGYQFTSGTGSNPDCGLWRDAANIIAVAYGTNSQTFRIYDTFTSSTDFHRLAIRTARATLSNVNGATVTATSLIPDGAVVVGVTSKVTTGLGATGGTTGYQVGDGSDPDRWGEATTITSGTVTDNTNWTATTIQAFTSANDVVITAVGGNFDGTGVIYVSVQYLIGQAD